MKLFKLVRNELKKKKKRKHAEQSLQLCSTQTERRSEFDLFVRDFTYVLFMVFFSEIGGGAVFYMEFTCSTCVGAASFQVVRLPGAI